MKSNRTLMIGSAMFALMAAGQAQAQSQSDTTLTADTEEPGYGDIIVTAQKREQNLQDVAGGISAIGSENLELTGTTSVQDLAAQTPSLVWGQSNGSTFVTLRGIGLSVDSGVAEPNVALHVDGVFISRSTMATIEGDDLERVEVLRGPQGTLYGRNATGGAINFISKAPTDTLSGGFKAGYGNFQTVKASGYVSGPLSDTTRVRLSAGYENRDKGFSVNTFTGNRYDELRQYSVRGALASDLGEALALDLSIQYQATDFQAYQQLIRPVGPVASLLFPDIVNAEKPFAPRTMGNEFEPQSYRSTLMIRGGLTWDIGDDVQLKSTTGYLKAKFRTELDGDGTSLPLINVEKRRQPSDVISQEFNLSGSAANGKLEWLVGAYYFHEDFESTIPVAFPLGLPGALPPGYAFSQIFETTRSLAAFTDLTFSISPSFRIYGGARYSNDRKRTTQNSGFLPFGLPESQVIGCPNLQLEQKFNSFSPRVGVQADLGDDVMTYAQFQKGFKSGGVNSSTCGNLYRPEKLDSYEAGFKSRFADGAVTLNASIFYYDYTDLQLFQYSVTTATIDNADARTYGAEIEARFRVGDFFSLDTAATLLDSKYRRFSSFDQANPAAGVQDLSGNRLDRAPKYVLTLSPQIDVPVAIGGFDRFVLRGDVRFSGDYYFRPFNLEQDRQKAYRMVNISASLASDQGLSLRAYVQNLTNKDVVGHQFYNFVVDSWLGNYLPPRTYGVELGYRF